MDKLTTAEADLLDRVDAVTGLMEEKTDSLRDSGVFAEYRDLHKRYVELIDHPDCGLESLKRALFIQWYAVSEPACFTGIYDVDSPAEAKVFQRLDEMIERAQLDYELRYMLFWYYEVSDWYFDSRSDIPNMKKWIAATPPEAPRFKKSEFDGRGQMARYWQSLTLGDAEPEPGAYADKPRRSG